MPKNKTKEDIEKDLIDLEKGFSLDDIAGIGPKRLEKLKNAGIKEPQDLIVRGVKELSNLLEFDNATCAELIEKARKHLQEKGVLNKVKMSGRDYLNYRTKVIKFLDTGASNLNEALGGGYESGVLTEFYGEFASGKTQFCLVAAIMAQYPYKKKCFKCKKIYEDQQVDKCPDCNVKTFRTGGLSKIGKPCRVVYIDTENSFRPERVLQIVYERELVPVKEQTTMEKKKGVPKQPLNEESISKALEFLDNITLVKPNNSGLQVMIGEQLGEIIKGEAGEERAQLVILDSIMNLFREEFSGGRGEISDRQNILTKHIRHVSRTCEVYNVVGIITNQVMKDPGAGMFGDPTRPIGGMMLAHKITHRVYLVKGSKSKITAKLVDSPNIDKNEAVLRLSPSGIENGE